MWLLERWYVSVNRKKVLGVDMDGDRTRDKRTSLKTFFWPNSVSLTKKKNNNNNKKKKKKKKNSNNEKKKLKKTSLSRPYGGCPRSIRVAVSSPRLTAPSSAPNRVAPGYQAEFIALSPVAPDLYHRARLAIHRRRPKIIN